MRIPMRYGLLPVALVLAACEGEPPLEPGLAPGEAALAAAPAGVALLEQVNASLAASGRSVRVYTAEYMTDNAAGVPGQTVFAHNVGNKRLSAHFVNGDPERGGRSNITYIIDALDGGTTALDLAGNPVPVPASATTAELDAAMATWNAETCSDPGITNLGAHLFDLGLVQAILGMGGVFGWAADVTHAGWLPAAFFDAIAEDGGSFILGVTFTFVWTEAGQPIDQDGDGRNDVAFREIYYNNGFRWRVDPATQRGFDVQSVAVHEAGHALSQGHFGRGALNTRTGVFSWSPDAVMNAGIGASYVKRNLYGTDSGGHCGIWSSY